MICTLTIVRYPKWLGWAGFLSMAVFRLPLWMNRRLGFWKLMGCGRNGSFDIHPDWRQWGLLLVPSSDEAAVEPEPPSFILAWWKFFNCERCTFVLQPAEGHGSWDGLQCFGPLLRGSGSEGMIAVLTRATIRLNRLRRFWQHVPAAAAPMDETPGFITSIGIGEVPWIKQATFSIWASRDAMKAYAYHSAHAAVIRKTRAENWYSEEMFVRFAVLAVKGTIRGKQPLQGNS
jgi:heme-degrading monooxygenase HmoA